MGMKASSDIQFIQHHLAPHTQRIPLFASRVQAGFPSPAADYVEAEIDLNSLCVPHEATTFFVRCTGDSMRDAGITAGDILVVDKGLEAQHGDIVIALVEDAFTVKELALRPKPKLIAHNPDYADIPFSEENPVQIFGVVTNLVRQFHGPFASRS